MSQAHTGVTDTLGFLSGYLGVAKCQATKDCVQKRYQKGIKKGTKKKKVLPLVVPCTLVKTLTYGRGILYYCLMMQSCRCVVPMARLRRFFSAMPTVLNQEGVLAAMKACVRPDSYVSLCPPLFVCLDLLCYLSHRLFCCIFLLFPGPRQKPSRFSAVHTMA